MIINSLIKSFFALGLLAFLSIPLCADEMFDFFHDNMLKTESDLVKLFPKIEEQGLIKDNFNQTDFLKLIAASFLLSKFSGTKQKSEDRLNKAIDFYLNEIGSKLALKTIIKNFINNLEEQFDALRQSILQRSLDAKRSMKEREAAAEKVLALGKLSTSALEKLKVALEVAIDYHEFREKIKKLKPKELKELDTLKLF